MMADTATWHSMNYLTIPSGKSCLQERICWNITTGLEGIYQESGDVPKAISYFDKTISEGKTQPYYFAANAALQCGLIYEQQNDFLNAGKYYHLCLEMDYPEYKTSLDQKAKAGLQRIKKEKR